LQGSIDAIQQHFGNTPTAYIWPGGGFSELSVKLARETGYKLGFTVNPRGPVMFNWVPMSDEKDPNRPSYAAEGSIRDPLMLLPRYWDVDASSKIDTVRTIGKDAAAYAQKGKAAELDYYDAVCKNITGEIPAINP
jgi:peptidoglycan/xylan/chitin deacetylase (PgdA/CDA1 family)